MFDEPLNPLNVLIATLLGIVFLGAIILIPFWFFSSILPRPNTTFKQRLDDEIQPFIDDVRGLSIWFVELPARFVRLFHILFRVIWDILARCIHANCYFSPYELILLA